jgi:uncharacterized repeat protein (TIGR02543 family)
MNTIFKKSSLVLFFLSLFYNVISQDLCSPVGWATQNGGTTGGGAATPVTVTTLLDLQNQAKSVGAKVIYVSGTMGAGVATRVSVAANKTIIGLPGATLIGGFDIKANNVIVRNMKIQGPGSVDVNGVDCITIDGANNVWIDHCDIYDGQDGNMDIVNGANYVDVTWCKFYYTSASANHQFCNLLGNSDTKTTDRGKIKITMMYNWWTTGCVERMPRVRFGQVHVVNNLFTSKQASYCVRAGIEADILVESNYFDSVSTPIDLYQNNFTAVTQRNNVFNATRGNSAGSGTSFTPPYALTISPAANVKSIVSNPSCGAGATMTSPTSCGCSGTPVTYTIATSANPANGGSVSGAGTYNSGSVVTLTATPATGYTFTGWSGDAAGTSLTTTVTMNGNKSVVANFQAIPVSYTLATSVSPTASGTVSGAGTYTSGTVVTLTATPAAGYTFNGWSGDAVGSALTTTVTMNANKSVVANFKANTINNYTLTTTANPIAGGSITGAGTYASGTRVTVTATPNVGYTFVGWTGDTTTASASISLLMNNNKSLVANFQTITPGTTATIRIEDNATNTTGLCSFDGVLSSNSGANNTKVINLTNSIAKGVTWKVTTPSAGAYSLKWRYVNSSASNTFSMKFFLNGVVVNAALPFPKTTGSTVFANTTTSVNLLSGSNTIRLESTAANATADIDWIEVTGLSPAVGNCLTAKSISSQTTPELISESQQIFPNPSNGSGTIAFSLSKPESVNIVIYDQLGKAYQLTENKLLNAGNHQQSFNITNRKSGIYQVVINGDKGYKKTLKLILL